MSGRVENEGSDRSYHICGKVDKNREVQDSEPKPGTSRDVNTDSLDTDAALDGSSWSNSTGKDDPL